MRRILLVLLCVVVVTFVGYLPASSQAQGQPQSGLVDRVAMLEHKLANLERIISVKLDDDAAVEKFVEQERELERTKHVRLLTSMLQSLRSQFELYQIQHGGQYPHLLQGWDALTRPTDTAGQVVAGHAKGAVGPYIHREPVNPLTGSARVVDRVNLAGPSVGWIYDQRTGESQGRGDQGAGARVRAGGAGRDRLLT